MARGNNAPRSGGNRPLYAIDFTAVACGKRIANTKRRVRWRFGFANPDALAAGETGTACRGEEHDVTMVWSVTSGKRLILADGQEVHYSNSRSAVIDFSWTMRGNHVLKVVAHATAPMSAEPGFRQYDFFVDGRSFFSFPKVYRLGLTGAKTMSPDQRSRSGMAESSSRRKMNSQPSGAGIAQIEAPHNPDEEDAYLREAIKASIESEAQRVQKEGEKTPEKPKISSEAKDLLIDFMDDFGATGNTLPAAPATAAGGNQWQLTSAPAQPTNQWATPPAPDNWAVPAAAQPPTQPASAPTYNHYGGANAYAAAPANPFASAPVQAAQPVQNYAAPVPPASDAFANPAFAQPPPPPPTEAASPMAQAYGQPAPASAAADPFAPQPSAAAPASPTNAPAPTANGSAKAVLTMNSLTSDGLLSGAPVKPTAATASGTMADQALQNLMGSIDSFGISGALAKPPAAKNPFDSDNIMSNATLGEIKSAKVTDRKQPVMNSPPASAPGAIVVTGNQGGNWGVYGGQNTSQYGGMAGSMQQPAAPQYSMSGGYPQQQQQMGYGQQPPMQQQQQPMMGQQPPMQQQGYGVPQYGQQPSMQKNQWGAPSY